VIVIVLGTGYPAGPVQFISVSWTSKVEHLKNKVALGEGVRRGAGKMAGPRMRQVLGAPISVPVAHFGHLLSISFDAKDADIERQLVAPSANVPSILFQVYGLGIMDRYVLEGYGYTHLPDRPGSVSVDIKTWKPVGKTHH
jgi:hypothetical protein